MHINGIFVNIYVDVIHDATVMLMFVMSRIYNWQWHEWFNSCIIFSSALFYYSSHEVVFNLNLLQGHMLKECLSQCNEH